MRTIEFIGRIVADAERKLSKGGKEYLSFRVANNEFNDEKGPDGKPKTYWFGVTSFNHMAMTQYLTKGKPVFIRGNYSDRVYQNREGNCDIGRDVIATEIHFIDFGEKPQNTNNTTQEPQPVVQTKMTETPKPSTSELKVPKAPEEDDDDALPF